MSDYRCESCGDWVPERNRVARRQSWSYSTGGMMQDALAGQGSDRFKDPETRMSKLRRLNARELPGRRWTQKVAVWVLLGSAPLIPVAIAAESDPLQEARDLSQSDDASSIEEAFFHGMALVAVIQHVEPNKLGVGGGEFRVKRNPAALGGAFVYDPRERFHGVERNLVWWVPQRDVTALHAYPLNSPSMLVTPGLEFPAQAGVLEVPSTGAVVAYVFRGEPMPPQVAPSRDVGPKGSFTMREYQMYRALMDAPMSESENDAFRRIAREFDTTPEDTERIVKIVAETLNRNRWHGTPAQEIRRASDWNGESDAAPADVVIRELSGSGTRNTRPFTPRGPWEIQWNAEGAIFQVYVYSAIGDLVGVAANQQGAGDGASYQPKPGTYYLNVNAVGKWSIQVVELSELPATSDDRGWILARSATGSMNTRPFNAAGPWEIQWSAEGAIFQVYVYSATGDLVGVAANQQGAGDGASYQPKPGTYYLHVNALGKWSIEIVEIE